MPLAGQDRFALAIAAAAAVTIRSSLALPKRKRVSPTRKISPSWIALARRKSGRSRWNTDTGNDNRWVWASVDNKRQIVRVST